MPLDPSRESLIPHVSDLEKVPTDARREALPAYLKDMHAKIASFWLLLIQSQGIESGSAMIRYRVRPDGSVMNLEALGSQGSEPFREVCRLAIREASPFGKLPFRFSKSLENQYLTVELTFYLERPNA